MGWAERAETPEAPPSTGRTCPRCGRPLDRENHEIDGKRLVMPYRRGRGRVQARVQRVYRCKLRGPITRNPVDGTIGVAATPQRIKELQTAFVHESRFEKGAEFGPR